MPHPLLCVFVPLWLSGRELVRRIHEAAGEELRLHLFAAPGAEVFYERLGFVPASDARELKTHP